MQESGSAMKSISFGLVIFCLLHVPAAAAGFDCKRAKAPIEKLICGNNEISHLDSEVDRLYRSTYLFLSTNGKVLFRKDQREFLSGRKICLSVNNSDKEPFKCLMSQYKIRIVEIKKITEFWSFVILIEGFNQTHKDDDGFLSSMSSSWPVVDQPQNPAVVRTNQAIRDACEPSQDWADESHYDDTEITCNISYINRNIYSLEIDNNHPPGGRVTHGSYGRSYRTNLLGEDGGLDFSDVFDDDQAWRPLIKDACEGDDGFEAPDIGEWLFTSYGATIECKPQQYQNELAPTAEVSWNELKPFLKKGIVP